MTSNAEVGSPTSYDSSTVGRRRSQGKSPITENDALSEMTKKADYEEGLRRQKNEEARKLRQQKIEEEANFSDEESSSSNAGSLTGTPNLSANRRNLSPIRSKSPLRSGSPVRNKSPVRSNSPVHRTRSPKRYAVSNGYGRDNHVMWQEKYDEVDSKWKDAMVSNAQLYNEKNTLHYTVETLKDRIEDLHQTNQELRAEVHKELSHVHKLQQQLETGQEEMTALKDMVKYRDEFIESCGLRLPVPGEEDEEDQVRGRVTMDSAERGELMEEIEKLKAEVAQLKASNTTQTAEALAGRDQKDVVRESTRLVVEYKSKLQIAEAENQRLDGTIQRLEHQIRRLKGQVENLEKQEDELIEEKRKQNREIRRLQQEIDELKTDNELLQKRIDGLRRRQN